MLCMEHVKSRGTALKILLRERTWHVIQSVCENTELNSVCVGVISCVDISLYCRSSKSFPARHVTAHILMQ